MIKNVLIITILFLFVVVSSTAVVITPIEKEVSYSPNKQDSCGFSVKSNLDTTIKFKITGDLNESVVLKQERFEVEASKWYPVECTIKLPPELKPGPHEANIISIEGDPPGGGLSAVAGILFPVRVFVPYPGKYLEISNFRPSDIKVNDTQDFSLQVISRGRERLENVKATIKILQGQKEIGSVETQRVSLDTGERAELTATWNSANVEPGFYIARVIVKYDGNEATTQENFKIGDIKIDIKEITHDKIRTNSIAKFNINLQSLWNSHIDGAHIALVVYDLSDKTVTGIKGETFSIDPWQFITKQIFWDTKDIPEGIYKGNFTIFHSSGKASEKQIEFKVHKSFLEDYKLITVLLVLVILLLLIILIYNLRKSNKKKNEIK